MPHSPLLRTVMVCLITAALVGAATTPVTVLSFTSPLTTKAGTGFAIAAAVQEQNRRRGGLHGRPVHYKEVDGSNITNMIVASAAPGVLGVVKPTPYVAANTFGLALSRRVPVFALLLLQGAGFNRGFEPFVHIRPEYTTEVSHMLNVASNSRTQCNRFFIAYNTGYGVPVSAGAMVARIRELGFPEPFQLPLSAPTDAAKADVLRATLRNLTAAQIPDCYVTLESTVINYAVVQEVSNNATLFDKDTTAFFTSSYVSDDVWNTSGVAAGALGNMYNTRVFPHPQDTSFDVVRNFRAAVDDVVANASSLTSPYTPPLPPASQRYETESFEAYLAARVLLAAASRTQAATVTYTDVFRAVYDTRLFDIDDFVVGPYGDGCTGRQTGTAAPCYCNSGARRVFLTGVNGTTGAAIPLRDDPTRHERNVAEIDFPPSACTLPAAVVYPSVHAAVFRDTATTGARAAVFANLRAALTDAMFRARAAVTDAAAVRTTPVEVQTAAATSAAAATALLSKTQYRYRMAAAAAPELSVAALEASAQSALVLAPLRLAWEEVAPATVPFAAWRPHVLSFWPAVADLTHAAASYASDKGVPVRAAVDSAALSTAVRASLNTFSVVPAAIDSAVPAAVASGIEAPSAAAVQAAVAWLAPQLAALAAATPSASGLRGVLIVASQHRAVLAAATTVLPPGGVHVLVCTSELLLEASTKTHTPPVAVTSSVLPNAVNGSVAFVSALPSYGGVGAAKAFGKAIGELTSAFTGLGATTAARLDAMYTAGRLSAGQVSLLPLSNAKCTAALLASRTPCQASRGLSRLRVVPLSEATTTAFATVALHSLALSTGRVEYVPLPSSSSSSNTLIYVAAGCGAAVVLAIAAAVVVYAVFLRGPGQRSTKHAPKDASKPFAIVFTDIQASTLLWAHAPLLMGDALDTHNAVIRRVIEEHKGYEVKTIGDSFMVAFQDPSNAVDFAVAVQHALFDTDWGTAVFDATYEQILFDAAYEQILFDAAPELPAASDAWHGLRVRVGVHYGVGDVRLDAVHGGYDYYGTVVNTAARVEAVGHGGQVLVTREALDAATKGGRRAVTSCDVTSLGEQPLRGLEDPPELHQLVPRCFSARCFPSLRLDVECRLEDDGSSGSSTGFDDLQTQLDKERVSIVGAGASRASGPKSSVDHTRTRCSSRSGETAVSGEPLRESVARAVALTGTASKATPQHLLSHYAVVSALLSTSTAQFRATTVKKCAERWRVAGQHPAPVRRLLKRAALGGATAASEALQAVQLMRLVDRSIAAAKAEGAPELMPSGVRASVAASGGVSGAEASGSDPGPRALRLNSVNGAASDDGARLQAPPGFVISSRSSNGSRHSGRSGSDSDTLTPHA